MKSWAHLANHGTDPNSDEDRVPLQAWKNIALSVDFTRINLIEQGHHDKGVENHGEMLSWRRMKGFDVSAIINIK